MTIKRQFTLLSLFIIFIPIGCAAFIRFEIFIRNSKQYLIQGTQSLEKYESKNLSDKDLDELFKNLKLLPPEVQSMLLSKNSEVIFSNISDYPLGTTQKLESIFAYMNETSDLYFYQFTTPKIDNQRSLLITRIPKIKHTPGKRRNLIKTLMNILIIFVTICFIMVILISRTIFKSIIKIEEKTLQLAEGNLSEKLISDNENTKKNEITSIMESLEKMRLSIIDVLNRKNKFIMGISHDLRTPVAIIKGYSEAISDGVISSDDDIKQSATLINERSSQLGEMIDTLINYMKLNETEMKEKLIPGNICEIIRDFSKSAIFTVNVFKRNITSDIRLDEEIIVPLNPQLINRSFENLFSNSMRYTNDGDTIELKAYIESDTIYFSIKDTGIGIAEQDLNNIFDMFYRGTNSRREEGMGIGLSVVKNIIDIHGWDISVESKKDQGTCFTISIPISR